MTTPTVTLLLQRFFTERLVRQRQASAQTIAAYRDSMRLLLLFAASVTNKTPSELSFEDLDATTVGAFLEHLETERGNSTATRNARLAAIHSFYRYALPFIPEHAHTATQVLAIPQRRHDKAIVSYLSEEETDALLAAPDHTTWFGRRDHSLLLMALQTGLRLAEITGLTAHDLTLSAVGGAVHTTGKGRKQRSTPLTRQTVTVLQAWLLELDAQPQTPVFPTQRGTPMSADAVQRLVTKHTATAATTCHSIGTKNVTPHTLRHTAAMTLLKAGVDTSVIALWLGHQSPVSTQIYLHADMSIKEKALARITPPNTKIGRYQPEDSLINFLENL